MTIKFAIRGSSMDAYLNSGAGKTPMNYVPQGYTLPAVVADAAAIGGQAIDVNGAGGNLRGLIYPGFSNCPKSGQLSILHRFAPAYSGSPSTNNSIISICAPRFLSSTPSMMIQVAHLTTGNLTLNMYNNAGSAIVTANTIVAAWSPTAGTYYDICLVWDGTTSANRIKVYVNGVLQGSGVTAGQVLGSGNTANFSDILIGSGHHSILSGDYKTNEYVIWDATIDPTSGGLNLNGSSRASFVTISGTLDPTNSTDPGATNVIASTAYTINGVAMTGSLDEPVAADVRLGRVYQNSSKTGTLAVPAVGNVRLGTAVDNTTGTLVVPTAANVRLGVAVDATVGTLYQNVTVVSELIGQAPPSTAAQILEITQGDTAQLDLKAVIDDALDPMDLTGASFEAYIKNADGTTTTIPNSQHTANADQVTYRGRFLCSILATQSVNFKLGKGREVVTKVTQGSEVKYLHGLKLLTVLQATPTA